MNFFLDTTDTTSISIKIKIRIDKEYSKYLIKTQIFNSIELAEIMRQYDSEDLYTNAKTITKLRLYILMDEKSRHENYLPGAVLAKVDRASMMNSLDKTPFLNLEVSKFAENIPEKYLRNKNGGKIILKNLLRRYINKELIEKKKLGFGTPNNSNYFKILDKRINTQLEKNNVLFWFSKSSNYLSNHYRKSIYKANTIHSLVSFLHKNEYRKKENLAK